MSLNDFSKTRYTYTLVQANSELFSIYTYIIRHTLRSSVAIILSACYK